MSRSSRRHSIQKWIGNAGTAPSTTATAGLASGTGAAFNPSISVGSTAGSGIGTGSAGSETGSVASASSLATGAGTAYDATNTFVDFRLLQDGSHRLLQDGTSRRLLQNSGPSTTAIVGLASGTGTAFDATPTELTVTTATPDAAISTGTAFDPTVTGTDVVVGPAGGATVGPRKRWPGYFDPAHEPHVEVTVSTARALAAAHDPFAIGMSNPTDDELFLLFA